MPVNKEPIGDYLYLFRAPVQNCTKVLIFGHSGWLSNVPAYFRVPQSTEVFFRTIDGLPNITNPLHEIQLGPERQNMFKPELKRLLADDPDLWYKPGEMCKDYVVKKGLGRHWQKSTRADVFSYNEVSRWLETGSTRNVMMHFVSVRNRRFYKARKYLRLSEIISETRAHLGVEGPLSITVGSCREHLSGRRPG